MLEAIWSFPRANVFKQKIAYAWTVSDCTVLVFVSGQKSLEAESTETVS